MPGALATALHGGAPIAPLPPPGAELDLIADALGLDAPVTEPDVAAVVATSGSTGQPKAVVLSRAAITAAVAATHARLGGPGDWVLALPTHHVAGLMVVARAVLGGTRVHPLPSDLTGLAETESRMSGRRYLALVPTQLWRACRQPVLATALADFDAVLLGGAAADPQLLAEARRHSITVVTTYGMSETCGGCVYDGVPLQGVEVDIEPRSGQIVLGGSMLFSGYRLRPDLSRAAVRAGRLVTADRGEWRSGRLHVLGRTDDVVISGGSNVDLAEIERAARTWPGLAGSEVAVLGVPDREWGTKVVVVTEADAPPAGLRSYLAERLPPHAVPREVTSMAALPRTTSGKIDRRRLARLAAPTPDRINPDNGKEPG